jgi:hypothetical protein
VVARKLLSGVVALPIRPNRKRTALIRREGVNRRAATENTFRALMNTKEFTLAP